MKRNASRTRRNDRQNVLHLRVITPRIVWFRFLRTFGSLAKFAAVLALLGGVSWGVWRGIRHAFYQNPDFRLQVIDLNQNPVIDELGVAATAGIDLTRPPSLFAIDINEAARKLRTMPAITHASVERHLPATLVVRIIPRSPRAWIACGKTTGKPRTTGAMLIDADGIAYPCPAAQLEMATHLPVIRLDPNHGDPVEAGCAVTHPSLRHCLSLLDAARAEDSNAPRWIDSISQANEWSLRLATRDGTEATFSLGDHQRQIQNLRAALEHAGDRGMSVRTINLIPRYNVPVTLGENTRPPRAIPVSLPDAPDSPESRHSRDLNTILNRP